MIVRVAAIGACVLFTIACARHKGTHTESQVARIAPNSAEDVDDSQRMPQPEMTFHIEILEPAVSGETLHVMIGIKNVTERRLAFSFPEVESWINSWGYSLEGRPPRLSTVSYLHGPPPGSPLKCPIETNFVLPPQSEIWRDTEISLEGFPVGKVTLLVDVEVRKIGADLSCPPLEYYNGLATSETTIDILPANGRSTSLPQPDIRD